MNNIYDIYQSEYLNYILPTNIDADGDLEDECKQACIVVNLYYPATINQYMDYINSIAEEIDVYIYTSRTDSLGIIQDNLRRKNVFCNIKENRGRDISTLLVETKSYIGNYRYICFLHDKETNHEYLREEVEIWKYSLWENRINIM